MDQDNYEEPIESSHQKWLSVGEYIHEMSIVRLRWIEDHKGIPHSPSNPEFGSLDSLQRQEEMVAWYAEKAGLALWIPRSRFEGKWHAYGIFTRDGDPVKMVDGFSNTVDWLRSQIKELSPRKESLESKGIAPVVAET